MERAEFIAHMTLLGLVPIRMFSGTAPRLIRPPVVRDQRHLYYDNVTHGWAIGRWWSDQPPVETGWGYITRLPPLYLLEELCNGKH